MDDTTRSKNPIFCITGDIDYDLEDKPALDKLLALLKDYDVPMTFPTTAEVASSYPDRVQKILKSGHELAGHGDVHERFAGGQAQQKTRLKQMIEVIYDSVGFKVSGFRAPWLSADRATRKAASDVGLTYCSNLLRKDMLHNIPYIRISTYSKPMFNILHPFLRLGATIRSQAPPHPILVDGILEIPITGPDDHLLIISDKGPKFSPEESDKISGIWIDAIRHIPTDGVYVMQAHPGVVSPDYLDAVEGVLSYVSKIGFERKTLCEVAASQDR